MKVMTILGTRPEIIRLSRVIPLLDSLCDHVLVHTGQNFDERLSAIFFRELGVREPDVHLGVKGASFGQQAAAIIAGIDAALEAHRPDRVLILGDTNSGLAAIPAARRRIPIYHMEAGNRCFDDRVPEELNRRLIDHASTVLLPYTEGSRRNLLAEGIPSDRILVTGNPIGEVMEAYADRIAASTILRQLGVTERAYFLATLHRAENVDDPERLHSFLAGLGAVGREHGCDVLVSVHPRTRDRMARIPGLTTDPRLRLLEPLGFFDFLRLQQSAKCVLSDSGTVQEEACILQVPNVTLRDVTERPETLECGSNVLSGASPGQIRLAIKAALTTPRPWAVPPEYIPTPVSTRIAKIVLGFRP